MSEIPVDKQRKDAEMLLEAVSKASGYSVDAIKHATKSYGINVARGVACVISRELQIIPRVFGEAMGRTRCNVVNISKHYRGYLSTKDKATVNLYEKVKQMLP